ncbi:DUF4870 domain-containing protein [Candidatus Woesearchaeota archaeon]|nr:DUF4870 domain-containing protein [Candidatus Woesearchaeota archaeon]
MSKKVSHQDDKKVFAFLGAFLPIIGFVIAMLANKKNKYVIFYAKQGLVLGIACVFLWIANIVLAFIPPIGWLLMTVAWVIWIVLWLTAWINALSGKEKVTPIIGQFADKFNI